MAASDQPGVLIVDSNRAVADGLAQVVRRHGFDVRVAATSEEACQVILDGFRPEVVFIDADSHQQGAPLLTAELKSALPGQTVLVTLTSYEVPEEPLRTEGFQFHFRKPVNRETLVGLLRAAARRGRPGPGK